MMKTSMLLLVFGSMMAVRIASAHVYPLQFTPNAGYRGLVVAGYAFAGNNVVGNCSYYTVSAAGGGKGGGGHAPVKNTYNQTCTWDPYGNLLGIKQGAPVVPQTPMLISGDLMIYAENAAGDTTGIDKKTGGGFVSTPGAHYTWLTPNSNVVLHEMAYTHTVVLKSDGDVALTIKDVTPSALLGIVTLKKTDCTEKALPAEETCSITVAYDPTKITSNSKTVNDTFRIDLTSNAGEAHDFIQKFTVIMNH
jgi:hypothetical protein